MSLAAGGPAVELAIRKNEGESAPFLNTGANPLPPAPPCDETPRTARGRAWKEVPRTVVRVLKPEAREAWMTSTTAEKTGGESRDASMIQRRAVPCGPATAPAKGLAFRFSSYRASPVQAQERRPSKFLLRLPQK